MNKSDRKNLYKCNKKDLLRIINSDDKTNKFSKIVSYIARHEMYEGDTKDDLYDLIYTARSELIAMDAKIHSDDKIKHSYEKLYCVNNNEQQRVKEFIRNPIGAINRELTNLSKTQNDPNETDEDVITYTNRLRTNSVMLVTQIGIDAGSNASRFNKYDDRTDIINRINKKIPGDASIDKELDRINSGTFGRLFRRPSKEYKAFEDSFNMYRDYKNANSGNVKKKKKNTNAYLSHLIPNYDPDSISENKEAWLNSLPKGQRKRAEFAMNVITSVKEHDEAKPFMNNVNNGVCGRPIDESTEVHKIDLNGKNQLEFQKDLGLDVGKKAVKNDKQADKEVVDIKNDNEIAKDENLEEDLKPII